MNCIVYIRHSDDMRIYEQYNRCADFCKKHGYSISGKVLDFDGKHFHEAVNKVVADESITMLMIYNRELIFHQYNDYLFYRIYLDKLGKKLIRCI